MLLSWLALNAAYSQPISPYLAGQNAWLPTALGSQVYNGLLDRLWPVVQQSKAEAGAAAANWARWSGLGLMVRRRVETKRKRA